MFAEKAEKRDEKHYDKPMQIVWKKNGKRLHPRKLDDPET